MVRVYVGDKTREVTPKEGGEHIVKLLLASAVAKEQLAAMLAARITDKEEKHESAK